ncbi:MAG: DUF6531 domain-containing protein [Bdellovibrionaceae bacterium]|nr:DUF6531 domain-containing protein [Pseudobdellovibrionaceae bacterium]
MIIKYFKTAMVTSLMAITCSFNAWAIVDMKDANYSETWTDLDLGGPGYILKVTRTYNSRSIHDGIFGFGWCSDFETKLEITPESNIKVTECGGGMETVFEDGSNNLAQRNALIDKIVKKVREDKKNSSLKENYFENFKKELINNNYLREAFATELGFKGSITKGKSYKAIGKNEVVEVEANSYKRKLSDGTFQRFDSQGRLVAMYDKSLNFIKITYANNKIVSVVDNKSRRLSFKYHKSNGKVSAIISAPTKKAVSYTYSSHDLATVNNAWGSRFSYLYDDMHNLVKIIHPDNTTKEIAYDKDKDWVVGFKDQKGCKETYLYRDSEDDPRNHYWSEVTKMCNGKVTNKSKYEFWHKDRADKSGKYLARVRSEINGMVTDIKYHETIGRPVYKQDGTEIVTYSYYANGSLKTEKNERVSTTYFYDGVCSKISKMVQENLLERQVASRKDTTVFQYNKPSCNLKKAMNSKGESAELHYDAAGRIIKVVDHTAKQLNIAYNSQTGKPARLTRPGLGSIDVVYDQQGQMVSVKSSQGAEVATQVANVFNNILRVIGPASNDISI